MHFIDQLFFGWMKKKFSLEFKYFRTGIITECFFLTFNCLSSSPCYRATQNKCVIWHTSVASFINAGLSSCVLDSYFFFVCKIQTNYGKSFAKWFRGFSLGKQEEAEEEKKSLKLQFFCNYPCAAWKWKFCRMQSLFHTCCLGHLKNIS